MAADDLHLRHARAHLTLLRELEEKARRRGALSETIDGILQDLDANWPNIQKAQKWCARRAVDLHDAALLCRDFACTAPDLLILRLPLIEWRAWLQEGLAEADRITGDVERRKILENLGHAHLKSGDFGQARSYFEQQLALAERLGDAPTLGKAFCNLGNVASLAGDYAAAERLFERALGIAREVGSEQLQADVQGNLAILFDDAGRPTEAKAAYDYALEISRRIGDRTGEARHLGNFAGLLKHLSELDRGVALYREQLAIARDLKDRRAQAGVLHNLGLILLERDELDDAVAAFDEARALRRRIGDRLGEAREDGALGIVFRRRGDSSKAIEYLTQWLLIARELGDRLEEAEALTNLGNATESSDGARELYEAALTIVRDLGHPRGLAILLNNLARLSDLSGDTDRALVLLKEAADNHRLAGSRIGEARSLWHLARICHRIGDVPAAVAWGFQALDIYHSLRQRDWVLDLVALIGKWVVEAGGEDLRLAYEEKIARALEDFTDSKVEWIRSRSGLGAAQ